MRLLIAIFMLVVFAGIAQAKTYPDFQGVKFIRNNDGDTFTAALGPPGSMPEIFRVIRVRLRGIDTPETAHHCEDKGWQTRLRNMAERARKFVLARLSAARRIDLVKPERGGRFRIVARVFYDGRDLAAELLAAQLAKPAGKVRPQWCKPA